LSFWSSLGPKDAVAGAVRGGRVISWPRHSGTIALGFSFAGLSFARLRRCGGDDSQCGDDDQKDRGKNGERARTGSSHGASVLLEVTATQDALTAGPWSIQALPAICHLIGELRRFLVEAAGGDIPHRLLARRRGSLSVVRVVAISPADGWRDPQPGPVRGLADGAEHVHRGSWREP
jgi:hypothetical protein